MPGKGEPSRLGHGRVFHAALQREWCHAVKEPVTAEKGIRKPSGRKGRIDVFVDDGRGSVSVVELKDTNWNAMTLSAVKRNVGRQCRQVWSYMTPSLLRNDRYLRALSSQSGQLPPDASPLSNASSTPRV